jgi:hypothetical protein
MDVTFERSQSTEVMPVQYQKHCTGITVMESGHPFIDYSKKHWAKQYSPISSQAKPSMVRRSLQFAKAPRPIFLTFSTPRRLMKARAVEYNTPDGRDGRALEEAEVGEALAVVERLLLDLREPFDDDHVADLPVPIELLHPARVQDGLRHL